MDDNYHNNNTSISENESIPSDILNDEPAQSIPSSSTMSMAGSYFILSANLFFRSCAFIIDFAILLTLLYIIFYGLSKLNINVLPSLIVKQILSERVTSQAVNFPFIPIAFLWFFYVLLLNVIYGSILEHTKIRGTLGKFIFTLYVVDRVGDQCSTLIAVLRNALKGMFLLPLGFGAITCFLNGKKMSLHDLLVGTHVLQKYEKFQPIHIISFLVTLISIFFISLIFFKEFTGINSNMITKESNGIKIINRSNESIEDDLLKLDEITEDKVSQAPDLNTNEKIKQEVEPKKLNLGKLGAFTNNDQVIEINDVIARIVPGRQDDNIVRVEVALFEQNLSDAEKQSLNYVSNLISNSSRSSKLKPLMLININYKLTSLFCENTNIYSAYYRINPEIVDKLVNDESIFNFVDSQKEISPSKFFSSSCEALMVGKDFSLRMRNFNKEKSNAGINWVFSFNTPLSRFNSRAGLNYFSTNNSIALFNKRTSVLTIAQYPNKLMPTDIQRIKAAKIVNPSKISIYPDTIVTIPIKLPSIPYFKKADLDKSMEKLRLLLKKENIRNGYTIQFYNRSTDKIRFPNNFYHTIHYDAGQTPLSIDGNLENDGKVSCRISGEKVIQSNKNSFKLLWKIFFNSPVIAVE